jgi:AcrR family transcriptional regulator
MTGPDDNTRDRLLDQAEKLFSEKGFEAVSVREITNASGCNLAAVNYHFGSKKKLYLAVFQERWAKRAGKLQKSFADALAQKPQPEIEDVISAMARSFLEGPLTDSERRNHIQLMQRELSNPGQALGIIVEQVMEPYVINIASLIRQCIKNKVDDERLRLFVFSMLGVILYFFLALPAVSGIVKRQYDQEFKSELVSHITAFCLEGIQAKGSDM